MSVFDESNLLSAHSSSKTNQQKRTIAEHLLNVNGKAEVAVVGKALFDELVQAREQLETLQAIQSGFEDIEAGRVKSADEVHEKLRQSL